ncbi:RnfABCDGE type electron transport complex subunit D [Brevibacillus fulvus]|uniref:Na+-translocating ferredoxin:NAD+ oxidoreductase RnfD subunit n=1 Tax=Brevibacillus fulvus TaxID=1125967 RepID=A0A938Y1Y7_9BACL|nr:RnfABCDGE type electron transport complex subunit D [Brevibacillus fulvus]MBM7589690.1 Na+-translocating ferredoxin:NAD+ oxidoreductase RnfD subunit [Brevibacillus fulvus]
MFTNLQAKTSRVITSWADYKLDPRFFILLFLASFATAGQLYLGFYQKWDAVIASVLATTLTELVLVRLLRKKWQFPLSAFITGIGVSLLLSSFQIWPYVVTSILSIVLKFAIRFKGGHVFNPNNVALVIMLLLLPEYAVSTPKQWTNSYEVMVVILVFGFIAAYFANRLDTVLAFLGSFTLFAFVRHWFFGAPLLAALGPLLGASLQLFTFFMITDPKTTPATRPARIAVAFCIAMIDAILRVNRVTNPQFYAVFVVCLLLMIPYRYWMDKKLQNIPARET